MDNEKNNPDMEKTEETEETGMPAQTERESIEEDNTSSDMKNETSEEAEVITEDDSVEISSENTVEKPEESESSDEQEETPAHIEDVNEETAAQTPPPAESADELEIAEETPVVEADETAGHDTSGTGQEDIDSSDESSSEIIAAETEKKTEEAKEKNPYKRIMQGRVSSDKMDKTIVVTIERYIKHPVYKKYYKMSKKVLAHDPENTCSKGDIVRVREHRPISARKRWEMIEIVERAK